LDDQGLAVDLAEARKRSLRELYSAAATPDWLFGRALCALHALQETRGLDLTVLGGRASMQA
jgi:hypothetical protein